MEKCIRYDLIFAFLLFGDKCILPAITVPWLSTLACLVFIAFRKFFFCIMSADFFVSTTEINVMIASLEKIRVPQVIIIPLAVLVRFFPTVKEEWNHIRGSYAYEKHWNRSRADFAASDKGYGIYDCSTIIFNSKDWRRISSSGISKRAWHAQQKNKFVSCLIENGRLSCDGMLSDYCVFSKLCGGY